MIDVKKNDGLRFMYVLLSEHVKFTAADQQVYLTKLMNMHSLLNKSANKLEAIEQCRANVREGEQIGIVPDHDLCVRDAICALGDFSQETYNALQRDNFFEPEVKKRPDFNMADSSGILKNAFAVVVGIMTRQSKLEDRQQTGKRKTPEAGAEIGALLASNATGIEVSIEVHLVNQSVQPKYASVIRKYFKDRGTKAGKFMGKTIEACALVLTNGQQLYEPTVKKALDRVRADGKRSRDTLDKPSQKETGGKECKVKGCGAICTKGTKGWYNICEKHFEDRKGGAVIVDDNGHEIVQRGFQTKATRASLKEDGIGFERKESFV